MDTETLITKVHLKPAIWDRRQKDHANRLAVDRAWEEISKEMATDDVVLKKKWKYLRDQFSVEYGKKAARSATGYENYEPKWPYYKSLKFLKDIVKPRSIPSISKSYGGWSDETHNTSSVADHTMEENRDDNLSAIDDYSNTEFDANTNKEYIPQRKRRRTENGATYKEVIIEMEKKKVRLLEDIVSDSRAENDDILFFRTLMPHISRIPENVKLVFRNRIQEVVQEFAYQPRDSGQCSNECTQ